MGFAGYLIKIGSFDTFFNKYIVADSFSAIRKVMDLDATRDATGYLHRNALNHAPLLVTFTVRPMSNARLNEFMNAIESNYSIPMERKLSVTAYVAELDDYVTQECYIPDPEFTISRIEGDMIVYNEAEIKFIGY